MFGHKGFILLFGIVAVSSLRLMSLNVPQLAFSGQEVVLNCVFDMEDDTLYSIKWYRDDMEFFRYVPSERPTNQFFSLKGLNVDLSRSSNSTMYITDVDVTTSGIYKCEISADAPSFQTVSAEKVLKVEASGSLRRTGGEDAGDKQLSHEKKLKDKLFKDYDKHVRPVFHHRNETWVGLQFVPQLILGLDEEKSLFTVDGWLLLNWLDVRLSWNASEYDGLISLKLPDHCVWQPDIVVYNGHSSKYDPKQNIHLFLHASGFIWYAPPAELQTVCSAKKSSKYPNDFVECIVDFGSWTTDGSQINITVMSYEMYFDLFHNNNPNWELLQNEAVLTREVRHFNCCEEPYITVSAHFPMRRRSPQELEVVWSPCVLVMTLTLTMFWIPSGSGKKIALGSALFLTLSVLTVYVAAVTKSPWAAVYAVTFLKSTMYAVASALVLEIFVLNLSSIVGPCHPPDFLTTLLTNPIAKYFGVFPRWLTEVPGDMMQLREDSDQLIKHPTPQDEWILVATGVDRILFFIYVIVLAAIHQI